MSLVHKKRIFQIFGKPFLGVHPTNFIEKGKGRQYQAVKIQLDDLALPLEAHCSGSDQVIHPTIPGHTLNFGKFDREER